MSAYCAVCERPFAPGERFALEGCYVVHQQCVGGRTQHDRALEAIRRQVHELDTEMHRDHGRAAKREADLREERRKAVLDAMVARTEAQNHQMARQQWQQIAADRDLTIANLQGELNQRRAQVPVATQPQQPPANPQSTPEQISEPEDGTALRFGLLELD